LVFYLKDGSWEVLMAARLLRLRSDGEGASGFQQSSFLPLDAFTTEDHTELDCSYYAAEDGSVMVGVWECAPCKLSIDSFPVSEFMSVISGTLTVTNDDGSEEIFRAGDTLFVPKGIKSSWQVKEKLRVFYVIAA
jgi:uncharacterized cupin superfamily protein